MGGKSSPSPPPAPDPNAVSQAQTQSNKETALYNFGLNNPNYNTPLGSLTYTQTSGTPRYDMDAYNKALQAYQSAGGSSAYSGMPPGMSRSAFINSINPNAVNTGATADDLKAWAEYSSGTPGKGAMPNLQDFLIPSSQNPQYTANVSLS